VREKGARISGLGVVLAVALLCAAYIRLSFGIWKNSDGAAFVLMARDILNGNLLLHGWALPPDNYYFTVTPLYVLGALFVRPISLLMYVIPPLTYAMLVAVCVAIVWKQSPPAHRLVSVAIVIMIIGLPSQFLEDFNDVTHVSTLILILLTFYSLAYNSKRLAAYVLLSIASAADPFALWVGALPIGLVGIRLLMNNDRRGGRFIGVAVGSVVVSRVPLVIIRLAGGFVWKPLPTQFVELHALANNVYVLCEAVFNLFGANVFGRPLWNMGTGLILIHLPVMVFAIWVVCGRARQAIDDGRNLMTLLLLTAMLVNVAAFVLSTSPADELSARYLETVLVGCALIAALDWQKTGIEGKQLVWAAPLVVAGYAWAFGAQMLRPIAQIPESVVEFLEEKDLAVGYGGYWSAGIFTVASNGRVVVRQVREGADGTLVPYEWLSAKQWYETDRARFVICDVEAKPGQDELGVNPRTAMRTWGSPNNVLFKGPYIILIWNSALRFPGKEREAPDIG
jgi:hypothetical protein